MLFLLLLNEHKHFNRVEVKNKNSIYIQQQKEEKRREKTKKCRFDFIKLLFVIPLLSKIKLAPRKKNFFVLFAKQQK